MAARPMLVTSNVPAGTFTYDGVPNAPILRGTVIDIPAGSALNTALTSFTTALSSQQQVPGSSDSLGSFGQLSSQLAGGGTDPYNAHQAG